MSKTLGLPSLCKMRLLLFILVILCSPPAWSTYGDSPSATELPSVAVNSEIVGPGVEHRHEYHTSGPLNIHVITVNLETTGLELRSTIGKGKLFTGATVADMARREERADNHVIAATNGDFWKNSTRMFIPVNLYVTNGMVVTLPSTPAPRAVFGMTASGKLFIKPLTADLQIKTQTRSLRHIKLNEPITSAGAVLYTPPYDDIVTVTRFAKAYELHLPTNRFIPNEPVSATVVGEIRSPAAQLGDSRLVLGLHADAARALGTLKPGEKVEILLRVKEVTEPIILAIGGGPQLLSRGKIYIDWKEEKILRSFSADRHPRTAVGISRDQKRLYLVTVDGRQPAFSIGVSLFELAKYLQQLGCWEAMNFDGGGSTTMVVRGEVVNRPSDRLGARTVSNALMVVYTRSAGPVSRLKIVPKNDPLVVPTGSTVTLRCDGLDELSNPVSLSPDSLTWSVPRSIGTIHSFGTTCSLTAARQPAAERIAVSYHAPQTTPLKAEKTVHVVKLTTVTIDPSPLVLVRNEKVDLKIEASSTSGPITLFPEMINISVSDPCVTVSEQRVRALRKGLGDLVVDIGDCRTRVPYYVDMVSTKTVCSFDDFVTTRLAGTRYDTKRSSVFCDREHQIAGKGCLAWNYKMLKGGATKIVLPTDIPIDGHPEKISLWIYGDGGEAWLRGEVVDAHNQHFMIDFTNGSEGITWSKKWKQVVVSVRSLIPRSTNPGAKPVFPIRITELYLAQDQDALKASGQILLDELEAIYPPTDTSDLKPAVTSAEKKP